MKKSINPKLAKLRDPKFAFGKYKSNSIKSVASYDPEYIVWVYHNVAGHGSISEAVYLKALEAVKKLPNRRNALAAENDGEEYEEYGMNYDPYAEYGGFFDGTSYGY